MCQIQHTLACVQPGRCFELDFTLGLPRYAQASCLEHRNVICPIADGHYLLEWYTLSICQRKEQVAFVGAVDNGICWVQFACQRFRLRIRNKMICKGVIY